MSVMARRGAFAAVLAVLLLAAPALLAANERSAGLRVQAYEALYNLDYDRAADLFRQAIAADPEDGAAYRGAAKTAWLRILFQQGAVTTDEYMGPVSSSDRKVPTPPAALAAEFHRNIQRAVDLAEKAVARQPGSAAAHYDLGAALGFVASYTGTIDGKMFAAMRAARRAFAEHEKVLELDPSRHDAGLVDGTYRYLVSALPLPLRWMAYIVGFSGGRETALRLLREAASYPGDVQADARVALILIYNREGRYDEALATVREMERSFPRNRLLWLEEGITALRGRRLEEAEAALSEGLARMASDTRPRMPGEAAHLYYKRGVVRLLRRERTGAEQDQQAALADTSAPVWIRGRANLELGKLADLAGDRGRAQAAYRRAVALGQQANDTVGAEEAKRLLAKAFRY
jgi:tetratricopeptide (TPR) repeat protein